MESAKLDEDKFLALPFGKVIEVYVASPEKELIDSAMISVSVALGNHPQMLSNDKDYFNFVASFVTEIIAAYVERAAAVQLGLLSLGGANSTRNTLSGFVPELEKVKNVVIVNEEAAEEILGDPNRTMNFCLAVTSMTALLCQKNREVAQLFGLKKSLFGGLKFKG
ncbi:MAG: hypothetical protein KDA57_01875 [Planctomycetales bacterium]|nr:hypothetical protein [Planctomycetales bacterium]